jgi:hypothetical protein
MLGIAARAHAQTAARDSSKVASQQKVAVVIFAEASAGQVSFRAQPKLEVKLTGDLDSVHVLDRRNLPTPVVAGTTYRDVYVAVEIFGRLNADCIAKTLTGGARLDCASLEMKGIRSPADTSKTPRS